MNKKQFLVLAVVIFILGAMSGWRVSLAFKPNAKPNIVNVADITIDTTCKECYDNLKDYQLQISRDSIHVYDNGKLIGVTIYGHNGIDSIINKYNE
jgi:hypothetical protein